MITRQGKQYVLFQGLLDEAHTQGLRGIDTELLQVPNPDNGNVAIVKAVCEMEDGRKFSGIGDASPENVGRNIAPHIIRMAETRAKARALRDAVNVGATALEELSEGDDAPPAGTSYGRPDARANGATRPRTSPQRSRKLRPAARTATPKRRPPPRLPARAGAGPVQRRARARWTSSGHWPSSGPATAASSAWRAASASRSRT
jgi:hypothetical protein